MNTFDNGALFSQETLDFLIENRMRNDKEWFREQREKYNSHVMKPLITLATELLPTLSSIDIKLTYTPKSTVSRIWRDARFSKDKSLFRDSMWCSFVRKKGEGLPEFFFVVSPENFLYGSGFYAASSASMESLRKLILSNDASFREALAAYENQNEFKLDGDMYKKSRHPDAAENVRSWLDRKSICFISERRDFELLYSGRLIQTIAEGYKSLAPMYRLLIKAEEQSVQ